MKLCLLLHLYFNILTLANDRIFFFQLKIQFVTHLHIFFFLFILLKKQKGWDNKYLKKLRTPLIIKAEMSDINKMSIILLDISTSINKLITKVRSKGKGQGAEYSSFLLGFSNQNGCYCYLFNISFLARKANLEVSFQKLIKAYREKDRYLRCFYCTLSG